MTSPQEAKLNMYNVIISFCKQNQEIIDSMPALISVFDSFKDAVEEIENTTQLHMTVISGITTDKGELRKSLAHQAATIAGAMFAYASTVNNNELKAKVDVTIPELLRLKDEELPIVCLNIVSAINGNMAAMESYHITADTIKDFNDHIQQYKESVPRPRNAANERASQITSLKLLFRKADGILRGQLDKIITRFILSNAGFYTSYANNRAIIDPGTTTTQIKGTITSINDNGPINGALVMIMENETIVSTGGRGRYMIKPLKPGVYSLKVSKEGYEPKTLTGLLVKLGQITTIDTSLKKAVGE